MTDSQFEYESKPSISASDPEAVPSMDEMSQKSAETAVTTPRGKKTLRLIVAIVVVLLGVGGYYFISSNSDKGTNLEKIQGKVALSADELRDVVVANKLTVFWAGPQDGVKYTLVATSPGVAFVRYLPGGVGVDDTKTAFRAVGTYTQKNAFTVNKNAGNLTGNTGFINSDGNAVFYAKSRPTNVYIGIKGKDIQVEVYDPVANQALSLALASNQIRAIG